MLSSRLKALREKKDISQKELAKIIGVSQQAIGSWEVGRTAPAPELIIKLADYFDVSSDYLLGRINDRNLISKGNETKVCPTFDVSDLPDEAIRQIQEYIEFIKMKYNPDRTKK